MSKLAGTELLTRNGTASQAINLEPTLKTRQDLLVDPQTCLDYANSQIWADLQSSFHASGRSRASSDLNFERKVHPRGVGGRPYRAPASRIDCQRVFHKTMTVSRRATYSRFSEQCMCSISSNAPFRPRLVPSFLRNTFQRFLHVSRAVSWLSLMCVWINYIFSSS